MMFSEAQYHSFLIILDSNGLRIVHILRVTFLDLYEKLCAFYNSKRGV